jgi:hypothetical protein
MNYIRQLNAAFVKFYFDDRLNPTHISLYMALFQEWNSSRFADEFYVNRRDLMRIAKIGSKSTYHRCVTDLDAWGYLVYFPSNNPFKGSKIRMFIISEDEDPNHENSDPRLEQLAEHYRPRGKPVKNLNHPNNGQALYPKGPTNGQALVSTINNNKHIKHQKKPNSLEAVIDFFKNNDFNADHGREFFAHYQERDWQTSNGMTVRDWRALAIYWMDKVELMNIKKQSKTKEVSQIKDNLRTTKNKNYGQPL